MEVVGALCVKLVRVIVLVETEYPVEFLLGAPELVAKRHHTEGGVVSEALQHLKALADEKLLLLLVVFRFVGRTERSPEGNLRLHNYSQPVGSLEGCIGRAAGVKAVVIEAVTLYNSHHSHPSLRIGGRKACEREYHSVVLTPKENVFSV